MKTSTILRALSLCATLLLFGLGSVQAQPPANPGNSGNAGPPPHAGMGRGKNGIETGASTFKGNLWTAQHIYYEGDDLDIRVKFPRGGDLLAAGEAEAHIVIYNHDRSVVAVPVEEEIDTEYRRFFQLGNITTETLPEGQYQLGLVITVPDGDPLQLADWYSGFRGLLNVKSIYVSAQGLEGDSDGDGEWDDDDDGDGIEDEVEDDEEEEETGV